MAHVASVNSAGTKPRMFYGWIVVAAAFMITLVGFGSAYTFSAFVGSLQSDFGASRGSVSLVFSLAGLLYFAFGLISGPLADRWGAKRLAVVGMVLSALGLVLAGCARTLGEVYAAYGLGIGLGLGCAFVPALGAVQRWFIKRRGFASGLAVSGIGVGTLVMPPLATVIIGSLGWRDAYWALGILTAVAGVGAALLIEDDPQQRGLTPDGGVAGLAGASKPAQGLTVADAVRTKRFLILYAATLIGSLGAFVPFVHLVPYAVDHKIAPTVGILLLSAIGVGSTIGRLFLGSLADRMKRDTFLTATYIGMGGSLAVWAVAGGSFAMLLVFSLIFGIVYGGWVAILPTVVADHFGARRVSGIIGVLYTSVAIGTLVGPSTAGFMFDASHSYFVPIIASAITNGVAATLVLVMAKGGTLLPTGGA